MLVRGLAGAGLASALTYRQRRPAFAESAHASQPRNELARRVTDARRGLARTKTALDHIMESSASGSTTHTTQSKELLHRAYAVLSRTIAPSLMMKLKVAVEPAVAEAAEPALAIRFSLPKPDSHIGSYSESDYCEFVGVGSESFMVPSPPAVGPDASWPRTAQVLLASTGGTKDQQRALLSKASYSMLEGNRLLTQLSSDTGAEVALCLDIRSGSMSFTLRTAELTPEDATRIDAAYRAAYPK